jgi:hypothetical protein
MKYGKTRKCQNRRVLETITKENINRKKGLLSPFVSNFVNLVCRLIYNYIWPEGSK